jgi:asparaginyl-tRNA synthetase
MLFTTIKDALAGKPAIGAEITIRGWVRTRRDSKAGFSFINVHDGSCFDPIQVVAPGELENYSNEVLKLTSGCAVECSGTLVESAGRGQQYEIQGSDIRV